MQTLRGCWAVDPPVHRAFGTGLTALDRLAPGGGFRYGAVHELLSPARSPQAASLALRLAMSAQSQEKLIVWSDLAGTLYPPAVAAAGVDLRRLILLRCACAAEELWAVAQCLGCGGVGATICAFAALSRVQARRLQLAAERGGGVGIFMRTLSPGQHYAAATRWLVEPSPPGSGDDTQGWNVQLLHGHGGQVGQTICLEVDRESFTVRASVPVAHRPAAAPAARITA